MEQPGVRLKETIMHIVLLTQHTFPGGVIDTRRYLDPLSKSFNDLGEVNEVNSGGKFASFANCGSWEHKDVTRHMHVLRDDTDTGGMYLVVPDLTKKAHDQLLFDLGYSDTNVDAEHRVSDLVMDAIGEIEAKLGSSEVGVGSGSSVSNWVSGGHYAVLRYPDVGRSQMDELLGQ